MKIEEMIDRVIVIDNLEEEIEGLVQLLQHHDIAVDSPNYTEDYKKFPVYTHNHQLVFMDLMLDEDMGHTATNISRIIRILSHIIGPEFGPYGLILWTKHMDKINEVWARFNKATSVSLSDVTEQREEDEVLFEDVILKNSPEFIIGIDKTQFKSSGRWDFSGLISILNQEIQKGNASYFFLRWLSVSRHASQEAIRGIYGLAHNYEQKDAEISHILYRLALNQTGIHHVYPGLTGDAYKAFSDILHPRINSMTEDEKLPDFSAITKAYEPEKEREVLARLNSVLFIDDIGISQDIIVPGNIYQVMDTNSPVVVANAERVPLKRKKETGKGSEDYKDYECVPIVIELTPPCDFSHKKVLSRVVGGYIVNYSANESTDKHLNVGEKNYLLPPIFIPGDDQLKYIFFDFRYLYSPSEAELKDPRHFKILFRANRSLFSDILQKFSSHAARLGLNGLDYEKGFWK